MRCSLGTTFARSITSNCFLIKHFVTNFHYPSSSPECAQFEKYYFKATAESFFGIDERVLSRRDVMLCGSVNDIFLVFPFSPLHQHRQNWNTQKPFGILDLPVTFNFPFAFFLRCRKFFEVFANLFCWLAEAVVESAVTR